MSAVATDTGFQRAHVLSEPARHAVAVWLRSRGYVVIEPPFQQRHSDDGDLYIIHEGRKIVVSVKQRRGKGHDFTGRTSYPYRWVLVETVEAYDRYNYPLTFFLSSNMKHAMLIRRSSKHWWSVRRHRFPDNDQYRDRGMVGQLKEFYACPKHLVEFIDL